MPSCSPRSTKARPYAYYALFLLTLANFFNYVDRQIVSIVGHQAQRDLGFSDAELGFLMGTAFAVLYGVFGIAMGRISDVLNRSKMMAAALALWSGMTALSGLATSFASLAAARIGVGLGESAANPCSHSLLSDYFPPRNRSAALGTYLLGTHLGGAASLVLGGLLLQHWSALCANLPGDACRIANWQAAFFAVGVPGLVLAVLVAALREPPRLTPATGLSRLRMIVREISAAAPPLTFFNLFQIGGWTATGRNLLFASALAAGAVGLARVTGDWPQWVALAVGTYSAVTWGQVLSNRDRPLFSLTFGCPTFVFAMIGGALLTCFVGTVHVWSTPYALRTLGASPARVGLYLGVASAVSAGLSVVLGGLVTDRWKQRDVRAPMWMGLIALLVPVPIMFVMLQARDLGAFTLAYFAFTFIGMCWSGGFGAVVQDLVLPRMRGAAAAAFSLVIILISSGIGPYWAGKISSLTGSITTGLYSLLAFVPASAIFLLLAALRLKRETPEGRSARAAAASEMP